MIISRIEVSKLYGYMNKVIDFNSEINLLVGINGSGKTSILNLVNWLLIPSLPNLCVTEFEEINLFFEFISEKYHLNCKQSPKELTIDIENLTTRKKYNQIQATFKIHPKKITKNNELRERYLPEYEGLGPEKHEEESWNFLFKKIPTPVVIGLDRNLYTEEGNEIAILEDSQGRIRKSLRKNTDKLKSPLEKVIELSSQEYVKYRNLILELNKKLNDKIMLSSFDEPMTETILGELLRAPKISSKQIEALEEKVTNYFSETILDKPQRNKIIIKKQKESLEKIEKYFENLKAILNRVSKNKKEGFDILYITNVNQFKKTRELIKEFEDFENKSKKFYEPLELYLSTINEFLKDSSKQLYFDKSSLKLKFRILDKEKVIIEENRDIDTLSSGEKQILILFTYIKFNDKLRKLFIIDEPELSLHPKWQESFLVGIKAIMPAKTQLLFATHSPAIVGKNKSYCKVLMPF
jgi:predicted ATPase